MLTSMTESSRDPTPNLDSATVDHFGEEWSSFTQDRGWGADGLDKVFAQYFAPLPSGALNLNAVVGDLGAGSGRWATKVAPLVSHLYVLEPSSAAMSVARKNLSRFNNVSYIAESIGGLSMPEGLLDVAYSLGVIHHIPDPELALRDVRATLKPGGIFLGYLYYAFDNRPFWFKAIWRASDKIRSWVSPLPASRKRRVTDTVAALVYWPLARTSRLLSRLGVPVVQVPLSQYSDKSFYVMRNDALDRLGTPLEHRFTRTQIAEMLLRAGFDTSTLMFSESEPFWCFSIRTPEHGE
jgi:SAM-dependent methyltransferase